jgi:pimeloyl-ACP methyl ester carboxylesterase
MKNIYKKNGISYIDTLDSYSKTPLLILHGWQQDKESWMDVIDIIKKDYRVICLDLPNFGNSKHEKFLSLGVDEYAELIEALLKRLHIDTVNILAHSFGGRIAIKISASKNIKVHSLILFSSAGIISEKRKLKKYIYTKFPKKIIPQKIREQMRSNDYKNAGELKEVFLKAINYNVFPLLKKISAKTLIIWGDEDKELNLKNADILNMNIKVSELSILNGYTHFAHIENPYLFSGIVKNFLDKNEK